MIGIYLLVSIFVQLSPISNGISTAQFASFFSNDVTTDPVEFALAFDELNGLRVGTPVLLDGRQVGRVTAIKGEEKEDAAATFHVSVQVESRFGSSVRRGTIGLQAAPMSASRLKPETVVELLAMPGANGAMLSGGETLTGFSSLEKFWSAKS